MNSIGLDSSDEKLCRLCLTNSENCLYIFSVSGQSIKEKLNKLLSLRIPESDTMTKSICSQCCSIINNFCEFYDRVLLNQTYLKNTVVVGVASEASTFKDPVPKQSKTLHKPNNSFSSQSVNVDIKDPNTNNQSDGSVIEPQFKSSVNNIRAKPDHLLVRLRTSTAQSDAQIQQFVQLSCDLCANSNKHYYRKFKDLIEHYRFEHGSQRGYAVCCEKKFYRKDRLVNHITNHVNPEAFKCPDCGQTRKSKILLQMHMKQHLPQESWKYKCEKCLQRFVLKSQLTNHEATHFTQDQKKFTCDICNKAFALKFVMVKHKRTHSLENNFICDICAKCFTSKCNLLAHMAHHQDIGSPRVQCPICELWYKNAETLRTHLHRHRDKRRHVCDTCQKECKSRNALTAHIRYVHLQVKQFECNICQKQFRRRLELTEHRARHTGETLYKCSFCPNTFTSSSNYFSHRKNRHPAEFALLKQDNRLKEC